MEDVTPYIIVDNQKLSPVECSSRSVSANGKRKGREGLPFGVIDRVTISKEARKKSTQRQTRVGIDLPSPGDRSKKAPIASRPLSAYSIKRLR